MAKEQVRLLVAAKHKKIEELPDYEGPADQDFILQHAIRRFGETEEQRGPGLLLKVDKADWDNPKARAEIVRQIQSKIEGGETGLGSEFYDTKNNLQDDAMACWKQHQRNPACSDYKSNSKRLTPDTAEERREAGLPAYRSDKDRYLCEFCPVHSLVEQAARANIA